MQIRHSIINAVGGASSEWLRIDKWSNYFFHCNDLMLTRYERGNFQNPEIRPSD